MPWGVKNQTTKIKDLKNKRLEWLEVWCFNGFNRFTWFDMGNNEERSLFDSNH